MLLVEGSKEWKDILSKDVSDNERRATCGKEKSE